MQQKSQISVKFIKYDVQDGIVTYYISVTDFLTKEQWIVKTRYSTLRQLHEQLTILEKGQQLPSFPQKKFFGNTDISFILKRQKELETYFNILLNHCKNIDEIPLVKNFLFQDRGKPSQNQEQPDEQKSKTNIIPQKKIYSEQVKSMNDYQPRFIDLAIQNIQPDQEDVQKKEKAYQEIKNPYKSDLVNKYDIPQGNQSNTTQLYNQSLVTKEQSLLKAINIAIENILQYEQQQLEQIVIQDITHQITLSK